MSVVYVLIRLNVLYIFIGYKNTFMGNVVQYMALLLVGILELSFFQFSVGMLFLQLIKVRHFVADSLNV